MSSSKPESLTTVYSSGPYHGLPVPPGSAKNLTAIVAGANGISGQHLLSVLLSHPDVWTKIYALSRSAPPKNSPAADKRVTHVPVDFLSGKDAIAQKLADAGVQWGSGDIFAFYMAYKEHSKDGLWSGQKEMWNDNGAMFEGFLGALGDGVQRIVLQTGGKYYGK
jgi:nucleoside-diphosphate-sugar epimerase